MKVMRVAIVLLVLLLLAGAFYWFQYRPSEAKKKCSITAMKTAKEKDLSVSDHAIVKTYYDMCMHANGL